MNIGRVLTSINRYASIIKETTGTALITLNAGENIMSNREISQVNIPNTIPETAPKANPNITLKIEEKVAR